MRTIAFASKKDHGKTCCVNRVTPPPAKIGRFPQVIFLLL